MMTENITAEIIAIGTEILLGEITDTNSVYIARALRDMGINVYYMTSVGDNEKRIEQALKIAMGRAEIVITCGGLGPTVDDMTRQSVATATQQDLVYHQHLYDTIAKRFASYQVQMPENNKRQAFMPAQAIPIENPVGTAPAFIVQHQGKTIISLPGVPREMKYLMEKSVVPYLLDTYNLGIIKTRILKTAGIGESALDELLGDELLKASNPTVGLAAHHGIIDIRLTVKASFTDEADAILDEIAQRIYDRVGDFIFGENDTQLLDVLEERIAQRPLSCHILQAGIGINPSVLRQLNLITQQHYETPDELAEEYGIDTTLSLRQIAETLKEKNQNYDILAIILSNPDIDEASDDSENTVVLVSRKQVTSARVYGFGAKNHLTQEWVTRWTLVSLWRMLKEPRTL